MPKYFAGGHNFHGKYEYVPVEVCKSSGSNSQNCRVDDNAKTLFVEQPKTKKGNNS
jgi:hypothetical protein